MRGEVDPVPRRRGAGAREERSVRHHRGKLELFAADALRLMHAKEPSIMEIAQRLVGQPAELFAFRRALLEDRQEGFSLFPGTSQESLLRSTTPRPAAGGCIRKAARDRQCDAARR